VLAGGCFWGVQGVYEHVRGVRQVVSGYAGGDKATATYEAVSAGRTGHAESVQIRFDPKEISYGEILQIFFSVVHDPTQLDRQGPDSGPSTARTSSIPANPSGTSRRPTSRSSARPRCSAAPSSPGSIP
jgi:methionine-S-sulfoxide reductase